MPTVEIPGKGPVEFSDTMSNDDISAAIRKMDTTPKQPTKTAIGALPGKEYPSKESLAQVARYGPIALSSLLGPFTRGTSLIGGAAITSLSEIMASFLERNSKSPEYQNFLQFMTSKEVKEGVMVGAFDLGMGVAFKGVAKGLKAVGKKMFTPKKIAPITRTTQDLLENIPFEKRQFGAVQDPFSLTLGQLGEEANTFSSKLESVMSRAFLGKGKIERYDKRNIEALMDTYFGQYLKEQRIASSPKAYGDFLEELIGSIHNTEVTGTAFNPVKLMQKALYSVPDFYMKNGPPVDVTDVLDYIKGRKSADLVKAWNNVNTHPVAGKSLFPGIKKVDDWQAVSMENIDAAIKNINAELYSSIGVTTSQEKSLKAIKVRLEEALESGLRSTEGGAYASYRKATEFAAHSKQNFYNNSMTSLRKEIGQSPETVMHWFYGGKARYSRLTNLKSTLQFSEKAAKTLGEETISGKAQYKNFNQWWDDRVLLPLRKSFVDDIVSQNQVINAPKFVQKLRRYTMHGDEYINELFGEGASQRFQNLSAALLKVGGRTKSNSMAIGLIQGGQMVRLGQAIPGSIGLGAATGDLKALAYGSSIIFLTPLAMTNLLTNPRLTRMLTEGISSGPKSIEALRFIRHAATLKAAELDMFSRLPPDAVEYFTNNKSQEEVK